MSKIQSKTIKKQKDKQKEHEGKITVSEKFINNITTLIIT